MPLQVVYPQHRLAQRRAQGAGHARPHQQRPGQTGATGEGDHVKIGQSHLGIGQHLLGQRQHPANVVAAGQLRHHAAIGAVHLNLAVQTVGQQLRQATPSGHTHQGHAGFVTRRFNTQDQLHGAGV